LIYIYNFERFHISELGKTCQVNGDCVGNAMCNSTMVCACMNDYNQSGTFCVAKSGTGMLDYITVVL